MWAREKGMCAVSALSSHPFAFPRCWMGTWLPPTSPVLPVLSVQQVTSPQSLSCFAYHINLLLRDSLGWNGDKSDFTVTISSNKNYDCQYLGGTRLPSIRWSELTAWKIVGPGRKQSCIRWDYFPCDTAVSGDVPGQEITSPQSQHYASAKCGRKRVNPPKHQGCQSGNDEFPANLGSSAGNSCWHNTLQLILWSF